MINLSSLDPSSAKLTLVSGKTIACIIVSKYIHAQHFAQEFTPRVNVPKVLGVCVAVQYRGRTSPKPARPPRQGHAHLQLLRRAYLWRRRHRRVLILRILAQLVLLLAGQRGPHAATVIRLGAFDEERRDALPVAVREPYDLTLLEPCGRWRLEKERAYGVSHNLFGRATATGLTQISDLMRWSPTRLTFATRPFLGGVNSLLSSSNPQKFDGRRRPVVYSERQHEKLPAFPGAVWFAPPLLKMLDPRLVHCLIGSCLSPEGQPPRPPQLNSVQCSLLNPDARWLVFRRVAFLLKLLFCRAAVGSGHLYLGVLSIPDN